MLRNLSNIKNYKKSQVFQYNFEFINLLRLSIVSDFKIRKKFNGKGR